MTRAALRFPCGTCAQGTATVSVGSPATPRWVPPSLLSHSPRVCGGNVWQGVPWRPGAGRGALAGSVLCATRATRSLAPPALSAPCRGSS